jgi:catechol-2,3-dioxygenase
MQLHELQLETRVLDQQRAFYTQVLELPLRAAQPDQCALTVGTSILTFTATTQSAPLVYHFAFTIPAQQFDAARRWLAARVPLLTDPTGADQFVFAEWNAQACYFHDPAGNICELIARHNLPDAPTPETTPARLLNLSEIGLVTDDVPHLVQTLQDTLGSPIYRGAINPLFTPVGDEHGLLIVVQTGRIWFPTRSGTAAAAPLTAIVSDTTPTRYRIAGPPYRIWPA